MHNAVTRSHAALLVIHVSEPVVLLHEAVFTELYERSSRLLQGQHAHRQGVEKEA